MKQITIHIKHQDRTITGYLYYVTDEELAGIENTIKDAQGGKLDSYLLTNGSSKYFIPRKILMKSIITIEVWKSNE